MSICDRIDNYTAVGIAEGFIHCDDEDLQQRAWQHLIDTGLVWQLQGWFGRQAAALIESGVCTLTDEARTHFGGAA